MNVFLNANFKHIAILSVSLLVQNVSVLAYSNTPKLVMSKPSLEIGLLTRFAPIDSGISIQLNTSQNLPKVQHTTLKLHFGFHKNLRYVKMYDIIGKKVFFQNLTYKAGISSLTMNISPLRPGIYFCKVYSDKGLVETRKLIYF